jgi:hypothetical protein
MSGTMQSQGNVTLTQDQFSQLLASVRGQSQQGQRNQQNQGVQPQGIFDDIGNFFSNGPGASVVNSVVSTVEQQLPNILSEILSRLANQPQFQQQLRLVAAAQTQATGVDPQSIFGDIGNWFSQNVPKVVYAIAPTIIRALPTVLPAVLSALASQPNQQAQGQGNNQQTLQGQGNQPTQGNQGGQQTRGYQGLNYN